MCIQLNYARREKVYRFEAKCASELINVRFDVLSLLNITLVTYLV